MGRLNLLCGQINLLGGQAHPVNLLLTSLPRPRNAPLSFALTWTGQKNSKFYDLTLDDPIMFLPDRTKTI